MRLVCQYVAPFATPLDRPVDVAFEDGSAPGRIGWREIVVAGDGVTTSGAPALAESPSARLTSYPTDLLSTPPDVRRVSFTAAPGGPALAAWVAPDATPLPNAPSLPEPAGVTPDPSTAPVEPAAPRPPTADGASDPSSVLGGAVPGGIPDEVSSILAVRDLDPLALLAVLLVAGGLGAAHALSPGHGKTVMAAYLVGSQGTARHAVVLGLTVTLSHTLGVLALAVLVLSATTLLPPERLFPILIASSGVLFVGLGAWMLRGQLRARDERRRAASAADPRHAHADHPHGEHLHDHTHPHAHEDAGWHEHGGTRHRHVIPGADGQAAAIGWRSLVALGLAGGLVPSVSALILLLGSLAAGRPAFGIVLVVAFGAGMAIVLAGIGVVLVYARGLLERLRPRRRSLPMDLVPIAASLVVIGAGIYVTVGAVAQRL
jgi:ABC-type nickel/cobalt efflux system permease component RcnA